LRNRKRYPLAAVTSMPAEMTCDLALL